MIQITTERFDFNPRSDERSDVHYVCVVISKSSISIHAPTNGATPMRQIKLDHLQFQSTLRRTERLGQDAASGWILGISIHAPTNGATDIYGSMDYDLRISIHAPTNGATPADTFDFMTGAFQSTLRRTERQEPEM